MMSLVQQSIVRSIRQLRSLDWVLLLSVFCLVLIGIAAIYSVDLSFTDGTFLNVKKQVAALVIGIGAFLVLAPSNYRLLQNYALVVYAACNALLVGVLVFGRNIRGATGWYDIGILSFQPVELMKVGLVIALATYFARRGKQVFNLRGFIESGIITGIPVFLVMLQPDFGSAMILVGTWAFFLLYAGIPWRAIVGLIATGIGLFMLAWNFFFAAYQKARIMTFLDPSQDPLGQGYNVTQAIIAIGSGGWFGSGLGFGTQSQLKFLPESQTDFIFAVVAEELGFFGVSLLLIAFVLVFARLFRQAMMARDDFSAYLLLGVTAVLFLQFLVNVGMNLGLFPVTGIGLPFVSYGGSSLVVMFVLFAIVQSAAMRYRER